MLRFQNTLSGKLEEFVPLEEGKVKIYVCGPTVWDFAHIGNFRTFTFGDILRRYIHESFNIPAHELTTGELVRDLTNHQQLGAEQENLGRLLRRIDIARFGHQYPDPDQSLDMIAQAERFVHATAQRSSS